MGFGLSGHGHAHDPGRGPILRRPCPKQDRGLYDRPVLPGLCYSQHPVGLIRLQPLLRHRCGRDHRRLELLCPRRRGPGSGSIGGKPAPSPICGLPAGLRCRDPGHPNIGGGGEGQDQLLHRAGPALDHTGL